MTAGEAAAGDGEASLLRDAVTKAFRRFDAPSRLVRRDADPQAIAREMWGLASELGLPGLMGPEAQGGQGLGLSEAAIVAEAMGRHSFSGPFMTTAVLARAVASLVDDAAWRERLLPGIAAGATVLSLATTPVLGEPARLEFGAGPAPRLTGSRDVVEHPSLATELLVLDIAGDGDGATITAAVMAARGDGVEAVALQPFDPTCPIARFRFVDAPIRDGLMARRRLDTVALDAFLQPIHVVVAAELLGVASAALDAAVTHAKSRTQFGQPIGGFQAIKHRLADLHAMVDSARLAVAEAANDGAGSRAAIVARLAATDAALRAAGEHIQILGGMGFSWESPAHLHLKRARRLAVLLGEPGALRARLATRFIDDVLRRSVKSR